MNIAIILGRLCKDVELKQTQNGTPVCAFTVAVDRRSKERQTDFLDCVAWKSTAEFVSKYFHKGDMIAFSGAIQSRSYEDKDGKKRKVTEINVREVSFCDGKRSENAESEAPKEPRRDEAALKNEDFTEISDSGDLPF